jgi:vitamin B12 transporter
MSVIRRAPCALLLAASVGAWTGRSAAQEAPAEGVVVRDTKLRRESRRDPSAASSVVRREELERAGASAADVLARVPGVQVQKSGSSAELSTASLRGATSAETPVYLAGIRLNDDVTGSADLSRVPLFMLDRVEVFRGSSPEGVDRMGIGGAVIFEPRIFRRTTLGAGAAVGSFGERAGWLGGAVVAPGSSSVVALRREHADNDYEYVDDAGTLATTADDRRVERQNADADTWDAWAMARTEPGPSTTVSTVLNAFRREQGVTGLGVIPARRARASVERLLAGLSVRMPCRRPTLVDAGDDCQVELSTSAIAAGETIRDPLGELSLGSAELSSRGRRVEQTAHLALWAGEKVRLRFGGGEELEHLHIERSGAGGLRARRDVSRVDASLRWLADDALQLGALGQLECHGTTGPGHDGRCEVLAPAGRFGAAWRAGSAVTLLANTGRYLRVPTLGELFGQSAAVVGNSALEPERGVTVDAGARVGAGSPSSVALWAEGFAFARGASDLIAYRRSSFGAVRPYNVSSARYLGVELTMALRAVSHVGFEANATLLDPRDVTPGRTLTNDLIPFQSRLVTNARAELYHEPRGIVDRVAFGASSHYRASRVADPAGLIVIGEQWTFGFDAAVELVKRRLGVHASVENVGNAAQVDIVGYPLPGRSYHASAEYWW